MRPSQASDPIGTDNRASQCLLAAPFRRKLIERQTVRGRSNNKCYKCIDLVWAQRLHGPISKYLKSTGYGQSKLVNVYMANEIEHRHREQGLHRWTVNPGFIRTGLQRLNMSDYVHSFTVNIRTALNYTQDTEQGCATTVWAALSRELEMRIINPVGKKAGILDDGHASWAYDEADAKRLWVLLNKSVELDAEE